MSHQDKVKDRIKKAVHLRKPDPRAVAYDKDGRWLFEVYAPKDTKILCR